MKINLIQHLPRGICILHQPGSQHQGKEALVVVIFTLRTFWLLRGDMFPIEFPNSLGSFYLALNFSSICFQSSGVVGQVKCSSLDSARKVRQTTGTCGRLANQPVILQGSVCFARCPVYQHHSHFQSYF